MSRGRTDSLTALVKSRPDCAVCASYYVKRQMAVIFIAMNHCFATFGARLISITGIPSIPKQERGHNARAVYFHPKITWFKGYAAMRAYSGGASIAQ